MTDASPKKLSVVMTSYNYGAFIGAALDAIFEQSYQPDEVIIVDDASTDNSVQIIQSFARRFPTVRLLQNERNLGAVITANRGLQAATGEYVYAAGADDRILPGFFARSMALLAQHPTAALSCGDTMLTYDDSPTEIAAAAGFGTAEGFIAPSALVQTLRRNNVHIWGNTVIMKRQILVETGSWMPELCSDADRFIVWASSFRYGLCYLPEPLASYRITRASLSSSIMTQNDTQLRMLAFELDLLASLAYHPVRAAFRESEFFVTFGARALAAMRNDPRHRDLLTVRFVWRSLLWELRRQISQRLPFDWKQRCRRWWHC